MDSRLIRVCGGLILFVPAHLKFQSSDVSNNGDSGESYALSIHLSVQKTEDFCVVLKEILDTCNHISMLLSTFSLQRPARKTPQMVGYGGSIDSAMVSNIY